MAAVKATLPCTSRRPKALVEGRDARGASEGGQGGHEEHGSDAAPIMRRPWRVTTSRPTKKGP